MQIYKVGINLYINNNSAANLPYVSDSKATLEAAEA